MLFNACNAVSVHTRIDPLDLTADTILEPSCILNEPAVLVLAGDHKLGFSCEENLRNNLTVPALNLTQDILVSDTLTSLPHAEITTTLSESNQSDYSSLLIIVILILSAAVIFVVKARVKRGQKSIT